MTGRYCWQCTTMDKGHNGDQRYVSRYNLKYTASVATCGDPFQPLLESHAWFSPSGDRLPKELPFLERFHECNAQLFENGQYVSSPIKTQFCVKIVGIEKTSGSNITARGCYRPLNGHDVDRDLLISSQIKFGPYEIKGAAYFCYSNGCNIGHRCSVAGIPILFSFIAMTIARIKL